MRGGNGILAETDRPYWDSRKIAQKFIKLCPFEVVNLRGQLARVPCGIEGGALMARAAAGPHFSERAHAGACRWPLVLVMAALFALLAPVGRAGADAAFKSWLADFWPEAEAFGISRETFDVAFRDLKPDLTLPDLVLPGREQKPPRGQAEFTRPPQAYINRTQLARLATAGRALRAEHAETLNKIERELGVEPQAVLAIWGRETAFGAHTLPHSAVRALATQAYLGRRKEMFRKELLHALRLIEQGAITSEAMRSSWAGAIGLPQLMPSEFDLWAYDLDGDGRKDIWSSIPDALATIARQLQGKGWVKGQTWGYEVRLSSAVDCAMEGPANARLLSEWIGLGVTRTFDRQFPTDQLSSEAYLMAPGGAYGPAFLVLENYRVIRRYNMSDLYAVFVGNLADRIAGGGDFETPWQNIAQLPARDVEEIQRGLQSLGYGIDKIDGKVGSNTRWQIGTYQRDKGLKVDCWPTSGLLKQLRSAATR